MSLGQNLQFLRKRNDITQEQLAEQLEVSRQSISKWESDATYPEMEKLLQLCEMFHCNMDDLLRKDISTLYVEDKTHYDEHMNLFGKMIALGVGLILFGLSVMSFFSGLNIGGNIKDELGTIVFFIFLIIAVAIFIVMGLRHEDFQKKNPHIENFYTEEEIDHFNKKFIVMVTFGVTLILIGLVFTLGADTIVSGINQNSSYDYDSVIGSFFLLFITVAVFTFIYAGIQKDKYNITEYNLKHDKESEFYKKDQLTGSICGCLMLAATIIYLIIAFVSGEWGMPSVVVFPVFGIGCGIVSIIIGTKWKKRK